MQKLKPDDLVRQARTITKLNHKFYGFAFDETFPHADYWIILQDKTVKLDETVENEPEKIPPLTHGLLYSRASAKDCAYDLELEPIHFADRPNSYETLLSIYIPPIFRDANQDPDWLTAYYFGKWLFKANFKTLNTFHGGFGNESFMPGFFHALGKLSWTFRGYDKEPMRMAQFAEKARVPTNGLNVNFVRSINMDSTTYDVCLVDIQVKTVQELAALILTKITSTKVSIVRLPSIIDQPILILIWWVITMFEGRIFMTPWGRKRKLYLVFFPMIDRRTLDVLYEYASAPRDLESNFVRGKVLEIPAAQDSLADLYNQLSELARLPTENPKEAQARYLDQVVEQKIPENH